MGCFICDKHQGLEAEPPNGYIYEGQHWMVCHFPAHLAVLGQLVIESKRHFLDFSNMTKEEAQSYGVLMQKTYRILRQVTAAERIYAVVMLEGTEHFHIHLIPRRFDSAKGTEFLVQSSSCDPVDAAQLAKQMREFFAEERE